MFSIVVCTNDGEIASRDMEIINRALTNYNLNYNVYKYDFINGINNFIKDIVGKKIYVINMDILGLELASKIRQFDFSSLIIFIIDFNKYRDKLLTAKIMALDYIDKCFSYGKILMDDIRLALSIINGDEMFSFKYNGTIWRISVNEICYIEKESDIKRCIIHTMNDKYYICETISFILSKLKGNFYQTHQSCIVNLNNVKSLKLNTNTIIFNNGDSTMLLTNKRKNEIKKYLGIDR